MFLKKYALQNAARTGHAVRFTSVSVVAMVMATASLTARADSAAFASVCTRTLLKS